MKHVIIGTAGHIDHGKTTLVKALTGRNTDRLKEEQERGISIELGFTYFDLPSGQRAGIIDVPGHEKFIKNMLAGVIGIDIVLLVVAADEGIMPQTVEHLAILDILGIKRGIVVLTKSDLVDEEWMELVEDEIQSAVEGTFLENSNIVRVSSTKRSGIDEVIRLIDEYSEELEEKELNDMPRLPVDRVFTISGFGTVVTGTLLSGKYKVGDEIQVFPGDKTARIRTLQVHDQDAEVAFGGQRVAINLAGIKTDDVHRGSVIAPINSMKDTMMVDVKIKLLKSIDRVIENRTRLKLYIGTEEILCRIVLLDKEDLKPGEGAYAQLRLENRIVAKRGDRFILRFYSPMFTIGGGEILEPNPEKKKRFDTKSIEELRIKETGNSKDILEKIIQLKSKDFPSLKEISTETAMLEENLNKDLELLVLECKIIIFTATKDIYPIHIEHFDKLKKIIIEEIRLFHERYPLRLGMPKEEVRSRILKKAKTKVADQFIQNLVDNNLIGQTNDLLKILGISPSYSKDQLKIRAAILDKLALNEFLPPKKEELILDLGVSRDDVDEVFNALFINKELYKINDEVYLLSNSYDKALVLLKEYISINKSISIGEFRDLLNTNRKVSLGLLEYLDQIKITKRDGEKRTLIK